MWQDAVNWANSSGRSACREWRWEGEQICRLELNRESYALLKTVNRSRRASLWSELCFAKISVGACVENGLEMGRQGQVQDCSTRPGSDWRNGSAIKGGNTEEEQTFGQPWWAHCELVEHEVLVVILVEKTLLLLLPTNQVIKTCRTVCISWAVEYFAIPLNIKFFNAKPIIFYTSS